MVTSAETRAARPSRRRRPAAALLLCIFVIGATTLLVVRILDVQTSRLAATRNSMDYERALYLAGAAVHHAIAELETDYAWRGTVTEGTYPGDGSYSATAVDGAGSTVVITGIGVSGDAVRRLQATIDQGT